MPLKALFSSFTMLSYKIMKLSLRYEDHAYLVLIKHFELSDLPLLIKGHNLNIDKTKVKHPIIEAIC